MTAWFSETLYSEVAYSVRMDRTLYRDRSEHQDLVIFENERFGRVLALDGILQTTERDEFIYHEMLSLVPIFAHGRARRVLIVGGGDGGMLRRCLMVPGIEQVTMVEIDRTVIDLSREYLPSISEGAFDDPRTSLVIADGSRFVAETDERFDVIIIDSSDPLGPSQVLFTREFYADCKRCLTEGGVLVTQNGVPFLEPEVAQLTYPSFRDLFRDAHFFFAAVPMYTGGAMAFGWATDDPSLRRTDIQTLRERFRDSGVKTRFYTPDLHHGSFAMPAYVAELVGCDDPTGSASA